MRDPRFAQASAWEQYNRASLEEETAARSSARAVAAGPPDVTLLEQAEDALDSDRPGCWHAFHETFVESARMSAERQAVWANAILSKVAEARDALLSEQGAPHDREIFEGACQAWCEEREPFTAWGNYSSFVPWRRFDIHRRLRLVLRLDPQEGLLALDTLPYPSFMEEVLHGECCEDRDLIEALIPAAPPVFDAQGSWVPERSVAALLVTDLITEHVRALHSAVGRIDDSGNPEELTHEAALQALEQYELPAWMTHAFGLLIQRPDGLRIGLAYLGHLSSQVLPGTGQNFQKADAWSAPEAALAALTEALRAAGVTVAQVHDGWREAEQRAITKAEEDAKRNRVRRRPSGKIGERAGEGARSLHANGLPFLFGAAVLLGNAPTSQVELASFWGWLEELLIGRDPGLSLITHGNSLSDVPQRFGFLLSRLDKPGERLRATYKKLEPQRRRALFAHRYEGIHLDLESVVLLRIGLNGATNWLDHDNAQADAARALFSWIYDEARRLWLTAVLDVQETKKQLVPACFAFMPFLFGDGLGAALRQALRPIASDPRMLADAGAMVTLNRVLPGDVTAFFRETGVDLEAALRDVKQWSDLTGREEDFPEHLQKLAEKLGIDFAQPPAERAPAADPWQALRETFATAIPWGAALLQRLSDDDITNLRPIPQDQPGTTWVLQGTLPEPLRARFALAPEIRILALHGTLRGHDLRRAVELPEGIEAVDPDLLVVASATPELDKRLARIAGPWGQRVPWPFKGDSFAPLEATLTEHLPAFDLFANRDPVRGRAFLGRAQEIEDISKRLLQGQAAGVFGLRKVGKSSLLQAVADRIDPVGGALAARGRRARVAEGAAVEALVVWLDVQSLMVRTREALAERLRDALKERLDLAGLSPLAAPAPEAPGTAVTLAPTRDELSPDLDPLEGLRQLLSRALAEPKGLPVCFIVDEYDLLFEGYGDEGGIPGADQILGLFRSLSQATGRVSLALIGRDPVFAAQPHLNGFTNPLLGWVQPFFVGPFADEDAAAVLDHLGRRVGLSVGPATVSLARRWTGNHPLLLREFGSALHALALKAGTPPSVATEALGEAAVSAFLRRDPVQTICGEVEVLLEVRFPEALALLRALASAEEERAARILGKQGAAGRGAKVLEEFGLVRGGVEGPWVPRVYRDHFRAATPKSASMEWSASHGK